MSEEETTHCTSCDKPIASRVFILHEAYCVRNTVKCSQCEEFIDRNELEEHLELHSKVECCHCKAQFSPQSIQKHQESCTYKPKACSYCNLEIPPTSYPKHVEECGSRTEQCVLCNQFTRKAYLEEHMIICQYQFEENDKLPPKQTQQNIKIPMGAIPQPEAKPNGKQLIKKSEDSDSSYIIDDDEVKQTNKRPPTRSNILKQPVVQKRDVLPNKKPAPVVEAQPPRTKLRQLTTIGSDEEEVIGQPPKKK